MINIFQVFADSCRVCALLSKNVSLFCMFLGLF